VQQGESPAAFGIAETRQPARLLGGQRLQVAPYDLDEEQLADAEQCAAAARA